MKVWGTLAFVFLFALASCSKDYAGSENDPSDASTTDAGVDATTRDGDSTASDGGDGGDGASGVCPRGMVPVESLTGKKFCIDVTEVRQSAYKAFLVATQGKPENQPSVCAFNTTFVPPAAGCTQTTYAPDDTPDRPVTCIDWCDAYAYCGWAGKRLCGRIGGGSVASDSFFDAAVDQWYAACSRNGTRSFPYGNTYEATKCNGDQSTTGAASVANVGAYPECKGGADDALLDMVGNVSEMEDGCAGKDAATTETDECPTRGGGFQNTGGQNVYLRCDGAPGYQFITRNFGSPNVGFRCCADL